MDKKWLSFMLAAGLSCVAGAANAALVINEILADPAADLPGDANQDGTRHSTEDEFVEIFNNSAATIDLGDWSIHDAVAQRHVFSPGTLLGAHEVMLVFGGGTPALALPSSVHVRLASSGSLSLNNGGDTISLLDAFSVQVDAVSYGAEGGSNTSLSRVPDIAGSLQLHADAAGSAGALFSPGTRIDGSPFAAPVPLPAAIWLFGPLLGLFGMTARKHP